MKVVALILILLVICLGCTKEKDNKEIKYTARIVGFDLNCSTCIVEFPNDSIIIKNLLGSSQNNYYQLVNLDKGNYTIGQELKVNIRKAEEDELRACKTLFPMNNYQSLYVIDLENLKNLQLNDTGTIAYKQCIYVPEKQVNICFDSVLNDSRCPIGAECFWAGYALIRLTFEKADNSKKIIDITMPASNECDTMVYGMKVELFDLAPYPKINHVIKQKDYTIQILIKAEN